MGYFRLSTCVDKQNCYKWDEVILYVFCIMRIGVGRRYGALKLLEADKGQIVTLNCEYFGRMIFDYFFCQIEDIDKRK